MTGGLTGFGFAAARWLAENGAGSIALLGRRGMATAGAEERVAELFAIIAHPLIGRDPPRIAFGEFGHDVARDQIKRFPGIFRRRPILREDQHAAEAFYKKWLQGDYTPRVVITDKVALASWGT